MAVKNKFHKGTRLQKSGIDKYGRQIINEALYKNTAPIVGLPEDMVEEIFLYTGRFIAAVARSGIYMDTMIPQFGKFRINTKKLFKRDYSKIEHSTCTFTSKTTKEVFLEMEKEGLVKRINKRILVSTTAKKPLVLPTQMTDIRAISMYKVGVLSREDVLRIFANTPKIHEHLNKEMDDVDYYKSLKDAKTTRNK